MERIRIYTSIRNDNMKKYMSKDLSVVIPTYNEKENIQILVPGILKVFEDNNINGEIVIVEDKSNDGSYEVLKEMEEKIKCLTVIFRKPPNSISRAWLEGFSLASKENIVCIDADLCHDPGYFPVMLDKMKDYDIVIGSRYLNNRIAMMEDKSFLLILVSILGQFLTRFTTGFKETDTSHSFRMFKKAVFLHIKDKLKREGNVFLIEFLFYAKRNGARVTEIPIKYGKRIHGTTKLSVFKEGLRYLKYISLVMLMRCFKR